MRPVEAESPTQIGLEDRSSLSLTSQSFSRRVSRILILYPSLSRKAEMLMSPLGMRSATLSNRFDRGWTSITSIFRKGLTQPLQGRYYLKTFPLKV